MVEPSRPAGEDSAVRKSLSHPQFKVVWDSALDGYVLTGGVEVFARQCIPAEALPMARYDLCEEACRQIIMDVKGALYGDIQIILTLAQHYLQILWGMHALRAKPIRHDQEYRELMEKMADWLSFLETESIPPECSARVRERIAAIEPEGLPPVHRSELKRFHEGVE